MEVLRPDVPLDLRIMDRGALSQQRGEEQSSAAMLVRLLIYILLTGKSAVLLPMAETCTIERTSRCLSCARTSCGYTVKDIRAPYA